MRMRCQVSHAGLLLVGVTAILLPAGQATAQFSTSLVEDFPGVVGSNSPFNGANWSLDAGCTTGYVNTGNTRGSGQPLIMLRGGTGTRMIIDLNPGSGSSTIGEMVFTGNDAITRLLFSADAGTGTSGMELYRTYQVLYPKTLLERDVNPGANSSSPAGFLKTAAGNMIYSADNGLEGRELHRANTAGNFYALQHAMVADINPGPGSSDPSKPVAVRSTFVFAADDGTNGRELWKTDTAPGGAGTSMIMDINQTPDPSASSDPQSLVTDGGGGTALTYFTADDGINGRELWRTDGTLAGTGMLKDLVAGPTGSNVTNLTPVGITVYFTVDTDGVNGQELWKSNGHLDGSTTVLVKDVGGSPTGFAPVSTLGMVFFVLGNDLWRSDGTEVGTVVVQSFTSINSVLASAGGFVYFAANNGSGSGVELWRSDGTTTSLVLDINPGTGSSSPSDLFAIGSSVYFAADDGTNGREPWRTHATLGAVLVKDVNPGAASSDPSQWGDFNGTIVFVANDGTHGRELWQTDGNPVPVTLGVSHKWDLVPYIQNADPEKIAVAGTNDNVLVVGGTMDMPTVGGGSNHLLAVQSTHQFNFLIELTDGTDRAPVVVSDVDCGDGSGWTRPRASLAGDGQPHNVIAAGLLAIMDQDPCDNALGLQSPGVPLMEVPVIYDGLTWRAMNLDNFPDMEYVAGVNTSAQLGLTTPPAGLVQSETNPIGTKRFNTIKILVYADSFKVIWHKRQGAGETSGDPGDRNWVVTVPRQYDGAFRAVHVGTPSCTPSPYEFYFDTLALTGGLFTSSMDPFGACCAPSGCTDVADEGACTGGTFSPWQSCNDSGYLCCGTPWADTDFDSDVDADDFGAFQACFAPEGAVGAGCECLDKVSPGTINLDDFVEFQKCITGPTVLFDSNNPGNCSP